MQIQSDKQVRVRKFLLKIEITSVVSNFLFAFIAECQAAIFHFSYLRFETCRHPI